LKGSFDLMHTKGFEILVWKLFSGATNFASGFSVLHLAAEVVWDH